MYNVKLARFARKQCCRVSTIIVYSECVFVALFILHAKPMRRIILSCVACPESLFFHIIS